MIHSSEKTMSDTQGVFPEHNRQVPELKASTAKPVWRPSGNRGSGASFMVSHEYVNYTGEDIYIKTQNNTPIVLEASADQLRVESTHKCLEVKTTYKLSAKASNVKTKEMIESMVNNGEIVAEAAQYFYKAIIEQCSMTSARSGGINTEFNSTTRIPVSELKTAKTIYLRLCDVVISDRRESLLRPHPNSDEGFHQLNVENARDYHGVSGVFIRIIDNERLLPSRYVYSAKHVIEIPSEVNLNQQSGVYVTTAGVQGGVVKTSSEFMTFVDAEANYGVYSTYGEAEANGDPEKLNTTRLRESELELSRLKLESSRRESEIIHQRQQIEVEKQNLERDRQAREHELASLRHVLKVREHDLDAANKLYSSALEQSSMARKEYYDSESYSRKDKYDKKSTKRKDRSEKQSAGMKVAMDVVKYAPAVVLGCIGLYKAVEFSRS